MKTILSAKYIALIIPCSEPNAILEGKCDHGQVRDQISSDYREMTLSTRKFGMTMILSQCISVFFYSSFTICNDISLSEVFRKQKKFDVEDILKISACFSHKE